MAEVSPSLGMMRRRADFVAATRDAVKVGGPLISLQVRDRAAPSDRPRVGFTATKRVGNAVERNRMKRRLRAAARSALAGDARAGCDYVLVARRAVLDARFDRLLRDLADAVRRAHGRAQGGDRGGDGPRRQGRRESGR